MESRRSQTRSSFSGGGAYPPSCRYVQLSQIHKRIACPLFCL